jgi:hypothetical protein
MEGPVPGTRPGSPPTAESEVCDAGGDRGRKRDVEGGVGMGGGDEGAGTVGPTGVPFMPARHRRCQGTS